jgi:hypothetical protein
VHRRVAQRIHVAAGGTPDGRFQRNVGPLPRTLRTQHFDRGTLGPCRPIVGSRSMPARTSPSRKAAHQRASPRSQSTTPLYDRSTRRADGDVVLLVVEKVHAPHDAVEQWTESASSVFVKSPHRMPRDTGPTPGISGGPRGGPSAATGC